MSLLKFPGFALVSFSTQSSFLNEKVTVWNSTDEQFKAQNRSNSFDPEFNLQDGSLERLARESELLEQAYGHYFDLKIINNDIEDTIRTLEQAIEEVRHFVVFHFSMRKCLGFHLIENAPATGGRHMFWGVSGIRSSSLARSVRSADSA